MRPETERSRRTTTAQRLRHRAWWLVAIIASLGVTAPAQATRAEGGFEQNLGQLDPRVHFRGIRARHPTWISNDAVWVSIVEAARDAGERAVHNVRIRIEGLGGDVRAAPAGRAVGHISRYRSDDDTAWHERGPVWGSVRWTSAAAAVNIEVDAPFGVPRLRLGSNPPSHPSAAIELSVDGAHAARIDASTLRLSTPAGSLDIPVEANAVEWSVRGAAAMDVEAKATSMALPATPAGALGAAETPTLGFGTFIGAGLWDEAEAIATGPDGAIYVGGHTQSLDFPAVPGRALLAQQHVVNAYVAKLSADGANLDFLTVFQGGDLLDGEEYVRAIAVDQSGSVYVAGDTNSDDFPTTVGSFQATYAGNIDAFAVKLNGDGTLAYSTFIGGSDFDVITALAIDAAGHLYVSGGTWSSDFPTSPGAYDTVHNGERDIFIAKLSPDGADLDYGSFVGGSSQEQAEGLALWGADRVLVTGWTRSTDFPLFGAAPGAARASATSPFDAFVVRLDLAVSTPVYSLLLGGADEDRGFAIDVDLSGEAIVAGRTSSGDFPVTPGSFGPNYGGGTCSFEPCPDAFVTRFTRDGSTIIYSGLLGGSTWDVANSVDIDNTGAVHVAGVTESSDFPATPGAYDTSLDGLSDAFFATISSDGTAIDHASFLGGSDDDDANAIHVDADGQVHVTGKSRSADFPTTPGAYGTVHNGDYDIFAVTFFTSAESIMRSVAINLLELERGGNPLVVGLVIVRDELGAPVTNAQVSATWARPVGPKLSSSASTNASGRALFWTPKVAPGTFTLDIDDITAVGYTYSPDESVVTNSITLP